LAGAALALGISQHVHAPVIHAQEQFTTFAGCINAVPKSWGTFKGASSYGIAFEDQEGTVRFLQHPLCGSAASNGNTPEATIDLEILRK